MDIEIAFVGVMLYNLKTCKHFFGLAQSNSWSHKFVLDSMPKKCPPVFSVLHRLVSQSPDIPALVQAQFFSNTNVDMRPIQPRTKLKCTYSVFLAIWLGFLLNVLFYTKNAVLKYNMALVLFTHLNRVPFS